MRSHLFKKWIPWKSATAYQILVELESQTGLLSTEAKKASEKKRKLNSRVRTRGIIGEMEDIEHSFKSNLYAIAIFSENDFIGLMAIQNIPL